MAGEDALFIELESELAEFYASPRPMPRGEFYSANFVELEPVLPATFATTSYPARGWFPLSIVCDLECSPATAYSVPPRPRHPSLFLPAITKDWVSLPFTPGDDSIEISQVLLDFNTIFPGDMSQVEILYPVVPVNQANKVLFQMDDKAWRAQQKTATPTARRSSTLAFRVDRTYMATFLNDLHGSAGTAFRLQTPGYTPFGVNSQDNMVYTLKHSQPIYDADGQAYLIDVTFLFVSVVT